MARLTGDRATDHPCRVTTIGVHLSYVRLALNFAEQAR